MNRVVQFANSEKEFRDILQLRYAVLRAPWNQSAESATDEHEGLAINAYIKSEEGSVIACGRLQKNSEELGQIRFMAVEPNFQGQGLGHLILEALEKKSQELGLKKIELQARENALAFYTANGYAVEEKSFLLWGQIQHYRMAKTIG